MLSTVFPSWTSNRHLPLLQLYFCELLQEVKLPLGNFHSEGRKRSRE